MHRSLNDIRRTGLAALRKSLGREGMIRFLQQFETGNGDYVADRRDWVDRMTLADFKKVAARRKNAASRKTRR